METKTNDWTALTKKNTKRLAFWTVAWTLSMAVASFGPNIIWDSKLISIITILINLGFGIGMIIANVQHFKVLDEMQKKIQLDAMGIALGVGIVCGLSYSLLDITNIIEEDAEIAFLVILMGLTYSAGIFIGQTRYK